MKFAPSLATLFFCTHALAVTPGTNWEYSGETGPENWAKLTPEFNACSGKNQSPVNLDGFVEAKLEPLMVSYAAGASEVVNSGHTVQVAYKPGSTLTLDGKTFQLIQFHFHMPSENQIKGQSYPLEGHLVHADEAGNLAVVALMFKEGEQNPVLAKLWDSLPAEGDTQPIPTAVNIRDMLPADLDYYRFSGSLTTPPCSEGVRWLVLKQPVVASTAQIQALTDAVGEANNRPLQPVNARVILK
ncbi:carbonate dehydratase [Pseudomonas sp. MT-1]|uniref:carbonic anhydrase n=1 Tax=Stutzerimonas stutzeri TaxID=316 RepID=UPI000535F026|nr:carbonic anhydrase family protein [Stutzerimonas stutzeri]MCQ4285754.1 carbonic anhydrase family protein [Stutzerimonas stutzeri]BAP81643.1 carbonate dehydratase [Pseudomonas sp. MT-1]